ncbi:MAG: hypothetical protein ABW019_04550 [Chitinophagaceae bacterium]
MNNVYTMPASFETRKNSQAAMITAGFAGLLLLLMLTWSWTIPAIIPPPPPEEMLVELNIEEPLTALAHGGGGGGHPVEAGGPAGVAPYSPPDPGTQDDSKDIEEDPAEKAAPAILKPDKPNPKAPRVNENKSPVTTPKPVPQVPAPPKPKAVVGKTLTGNGQGGGAAGTYDRAGGAGTGYGAGNGSGSGGGTGSGSGGGNGPGIGSGNGPSVIKGDRRIVSAYAFEGDLDKATILAEIKVSTDGTGQFVQFARGSSSSSSAYRSAIVQYLRRIKFNQSDHESVVTVQFNFRVNG